MNKLYKYCPFCGMEECLEDEIAVVDEGVANLTTVVICEYCGVIFIMDGEDFNQRAFNNKREVVMGKNIEFVLSWVVDELAEVVADRELQKRYRAGENVDCRVKDTVRKQYREKLARFLDAK